MIFLLEGEYFYDTSSYRNANVIKDNSESINIQR